MLAALLVLVASTAIAVPASIGAETVYRVPVLMYHRVKPASEVSPTEQFPDLFLDPALFDAQIAALKAWGWHPISTSTLAAAVRAGTTLPARSIVLSFDDGRPDNYKYAFPILKKYGFTATFYVVPGRIGTSAHMTAAQIEEMHAAGNEIADHTWDHTDLTTLSYSAARTEIRRAADAIESLVGTRPTTLAYPYGAENSTVRSAANDEGMSMAFTTVYGASESIATRLAEPRLRIHGYSRRSDGSLAGGTTAAQLMTMLAPYGPPLVSAPAPGLYGGTLSSTVPVRETWSVKDAVGISSYSLMRQVGAGSWSVQSLATTTSTTKTLTQSLTFGSAYRYRARATNTSGAVSPWAYGASFTPFLTQESSTDIAWSGTWMTVANTAYSGGAVRRASAAGASATWSFSGSSVAWVAIKGPTRGSAELWIDGTRVTTVDLYSTTTTVRQLVYARNWAVNGMHTLEIVVLGTTGHPRVDVDGFVRLVRG